MRIVTKDELDKVNENYYVWYACYGSNINLDRLMIYINGDKKGIYSQYEGCRKKYKPYDTILYVGNYENLPIYTFTASKQENLELPSKEYCDVIKKGIIDTYKFLSNDDVDKYFERIISIIE